MGQEARPFKIAESCTRSLKNKILIRSADAARLIEIRHHSRIEHASFKIEKFVFPLILFTRRKNMKG